MRDQINIERELNALQAVTLAIILWGAIAIQIFMHEQPCSLCLLQRLGMLGVASGALMNVKCRPRRSHYGLSLLSAIFGGFVALRQICLHICPQFPTFGKPFWGLSLYTWSFLIFASSVAYIALLLLFFAPKEREEKVYSLAWWGYLAFTLVFLAAIANIFITLWLCGLGACTEI